MDATGAIFSPVPVGEARPATARGSTLAYAVFLLINATLFIRPTEIVPGLLGLPLYEVLNLVCIALSLPLILRQLSACGMAAAPITACVVGMQVAIILSHLARFSLTDVLASVNEFVKVLLYYLMLVGLIDDRRRLRGFALCLLVSTCVLTALALLQFHGIVDLPAFKSAVEHWDGGDDEDADGAGILLRLCGTGLFGNPNDLSRILVIGLVLSAFFIMSPQTRVLMRVVWVAAFLMLAYALQETHSRGGLLAFFAAVAVLFHARFGLVKSVVLGALVVPIVLAAFAGRQLEMSTSSGTGQQRIQVWAEGLELFRTAPFFGIGMNQHVVELGIVAHNSFVHCYVELGFLGGTFFVGAFFLAFWFPFKLTGPAAGPDPALGRFRPYILAIVAGYAVGMFSSTRSYNLPTYLVIGLAAAYVNIAGAHRLPEFRLSGALVARVTFVSIVVLAFTFVYVRRSVV